LFAIRRRDCYVAPATNPALDSTLWVFAELKTIRHHLLQKSGRLTKPYGKLTLSMNPNAAVKEDLMQFLDILKKAT
jgi:hypothetical protein